MSLRKTIILWFSLAAATPTALFGLYLGIIECRAGFAKAEQELHAKLARLQSDSSRHFASGLADLQFASQMVEVRKLNEGITSGDVDEINYWSSALEKALVTFAENRKVFRELRFLGASGRKTARIRLTDGHATIVKDTNSPPPTGEREALEAKQPTAGWETSNGSSSVWLFIPIPGKNPAVLSGHLELTALRSMLTDPSVLLEQMTDGKGQTLVLAAAPEEGPAPPNPSRSEPPSRPAEVEGKSLKASATFTPTASAPSLQLRLTVHRQEDEVWAPIRRLLLETATLCAVATLLAVACGFWRSRSITRPIQGITRRLHGIAEQSCAASRQIAESSQQLASDASRQAASQEETSASLEQVASQIHQNTQTASQVRELASQARLAGDSGLKETQAMDSAMSAILQSSADIAKIVKTINEIALQTNLLALNAAIEAARAGEAGQGFAVVADEVRTLAQRAARAARDTAELVESSARKCTAGAEISSKVGKSLGEIVERTRRVDELASTVASVSEEQNTGIQQISAAAAEIDKLTQSNAGNADASAGAAAELSSHAASLTEAISELQQVIDGRSSQLPTPRPPARPDGTRRSNTLAAAPAEETTQRDPQDPHRVVIE